MDMLKICHHPRRAEVLVSELV